MPKTMKAACYYGAHDIRVEEVPVPKYGPGGVLVRVKACGVCNIIDTKAWTTRSGRGVGFAMGHEWSGEVAEVGSEVTDLKVGDKVYGSRSTPCYRCEACRQGDYWRCINLLGGGGGAPSHGAFSEYVVFPFISENNVLVYPPEMNFRDIAMAEPMELSIGIAKKAKAGDTVAIIGQDLVGIGLVACLKERKVGKIITSDLSPLRLNAAKSVGADITLDALKENVVDVVMQETKGWGADVVVVMEGRPIAIQQAMSLVKAGGQIWLTQGGYLELNPNVVTMHPINFRQVDAGYSEPGIRFDAGLFGMQSAWGTLGPYKPRWAKIIDLAKAGIITADKFVTHVYPLEKTAEAFEMATNSYESIKVMVEP